MRRQRKPVGPIKQMIEHAAEAEARKMAKELHGSDGLWELYLIDAYRRVAGLPPPSYGDSQP